MGADLGFLQGIKRLIRNLSNTQSGIIDYNDYMAVGGMDYFSILTAMDDVPVTIDDTNTVMTTDETYVYLIGGSSVKTVWRLDPSTGNWSQMADVNVTTSYRDFTAIHIGGYIYCIGGVVDGSATNAIRKLDVLGNSWFTLSGTLLTATAGVCIFHDTVAQRLYMYRGTDAQYIDLTDDSVVTITSPTAGTATFIQASPIIELENGKYLSYVGATNESVILTGLNPPNNYTQLTTVDDYLDLERCAEVKALGDSLYCANDPDGAKFVVIDKNSGMQFSVPKTDGYGRASAIQPIGHSVIVPFFYAMNKYDILTQADNDADHCHQVDIRQFFVPVADVKAGQKAFTTGLGFITPKARTDLTFFDGYERVKRSQEHESTVDGTFYVFIGQSSSATDKISWYVR